MEKKTKIGDDMGDEEDGGRPVTTDDEYENEEGDEQFEK